MGLAQRHCRIGLLRTSAVCVPNLLLLVESTGSGPH
jgi:hypothetical protein